MRPEDTHEHCYHPYHGPIMRVVPDGHIILKCCKCDDRQIVHRDHVR